MNTGNMTHGRASLLGTHFDYRFVVLEDEELGRVVGIECRHVGWYEINLREELLQIRFRVFLGKRVWSRLRFRNP